MRIVRPTRVRTALDLALACAIAALALGLRAAPAAFLAFAIAALATLALPWLEWPTPPALVQRALPRLHGLVLLTVALLAWFSRSLAVMDVPAATLAALGGAVVVPIALVFALGPLAFPPGRTLVPSILCLLALAGLDPAPPGYGRSLLPFLKGTEHTAFAEVFLAIAVVVLVALWSSTLAESGPRWRARDVPGQVVAAVVAFGVSAAGVVGLPLLQPRVERALANALDQGRTGLSGESTLGEFAELAVSRRRVLDLQAAPLVAGPAAADGPWRLRSEVFTVFDGRRWTLPRQTPGERGGRFLQPASALDGGPLLEDLGPWFHLSPTADAHFPGADAHSAGVTHAAGLVAVRINQLEVGRWPLLLPRSVSAVTAEADSLLLDGYGSVRRPGGLPVQLYGAIVPAAAGGAGPGLPEALPAAERAQSLTLPSRIHSRVRQLASSLAPETATPRERLDATLAHLQSGYAYTLRPGPFVTDDPLAEFLFDKKAGYCEYFATAAVVLLRLQGVPARFVKGLSLGPQTDQGGGLHVVRESDAHAWVEAWLPGEGWVEADPTPAAPLAAARAAPGALDRMVQRARAALALAWARGVTRGPLALVRALARGLAALVDRLVREPVSWLALAAFVFAPRLRALWRSHRQRRRAAAIDDSATVAVELRTLVRDVERRWRALGRPRPAGHGLLEHARAVCASAESGAPVPAPLAAACLEIVEVYYRARFGGEAPSAAVLARLRL